MKKHKIKITETLERIVEVEAGSSGAAFLNVQEKWIHNDVRLDEDNFVAVEFQHVQ